MYNVLGAVIVLLIGMIAFLFYRLHIKEAHYRSTCTHTRSFRLKHWSAEIITRLKDKGFSLCIDNFGSVHSPLNLFKVFPIERIKLDRSFLNRNSSSDEGLTILRYLTAMAKELNLTVITEGMESLEQANFLTDIGCDIAQGYFQASYHPALRPA